MNLIMWINDLFSWPGVVCGVVAGIVTMGFLFQRVKALGRRIGYSQAEFHAARLFNPLAHDLDKMRYRLYGVPFMNLTLQTTSDDKITRMARRANQDWKDIKRKIERGDIFEPVNDDDDDL